MSSARYPVHVLIALLPLHLCSCIVSEQIFIEFAVNEDLSGEVVLEEMGIHSNADDPAKAEHEFQEYVDRGYQKAGENWVRFFGLDASDVCLTNRTATHCDLIVRGSFPHLARAVSVFAGAGTFDLRQTDRYFQVRFSPPGDVEEGSDDDVEIALQYAGAVISHNADAVDPATGTLSWNGSTLHKTGLQFILEIRPDEPE